MKTVDNDDVELISIRTKSLQDVDNEINLTENKNGNSFKNIFTANAGDKNFSNRSESHDQEEAESDDDHYESVVRFVALDKSPNGTCGFHLTRTKWDPYPWISVVDKFTPAATSDLKAGDCVLEVNGCDVLGLRITEIAKLVKSSQHQVTLLLWRSNCNNECDKESLCAAPMPRSLQRLSLVVQTILNLIECPVCLDTITPPAMQCQNGHLLCVNCRIRAEKCPVCRDRYFPRPALIAEQIQSGITSAFNLCRNEDKVRQKIFGRHNRQRQMVKTTLECLQQKQYQAHHPVHESLKAYEQRKKGAESEVEAPSTAIKALDGATTSTSTSTSTPTTINRKCDGIVADKLFKCARCSSTDKEATCNKFLTKRSNSKAYSMENLINGHNNTTTATTTTINNILSTCHAVTMPALTQHELLDKPQQQTQRQHQKTSQNQMGAPGQLTTFKVFAPQLQNTQTSAVTHRNQFNDLASIVARNHHYSLTSEPKLNALEIDLNINSKLCCKQMLNNQMKCVPSSSRARDLTRNEENITCLLESPALVMNDENKIACSPVLLCETLYATIPRAINLKKKEQKKTIRCQFDVKAGNKETAITSPKSHSSSMTSLNLSSATPHNLCCSTSSVSFENYSCQSSLSASASASSSASTSPTMSSS